MIIKEVQDYQYFADMDQEKIEDKDEVLIIPFRVISSMKVIINKNQIKDLTTEQFSETMEKELIIILKNKQKENEP